MAEEVTDRVWVIMDDGPVAGFVTERSIRQRELTFKLCDETIEYYRRTTWDQNGRIAHFKFAGSRAV